MQLVGERRGGPSGSAGIDGVMPHEVVEPMSAEDVAAVLASASKQRRSVVIRGGGTKMGWGRTPSSLDLVLNTTRLNAVVAHEHADLTATVQAGAGLDEVNHVLARHGQWLPIESAFDGSTIGGAIATNDSGPLRHRYGTPRDLLIGIRLALTDGRLIKAGGNVVKNVAGYDIGRLMSGSHGSLAAIVSATFKLSPLPAATQTLVATFDRREALAAAVSAITSSQLEPAAIDLRSGPAKAGPYRLLLKFESTPTAVDTYVQRARADATCRLAGRHVAVRNRFVARAHPRRVGRSGHDRQIRMVAGVARRRAHFRGGVAEYRRRRGVDWPRRAWLGPPSHRC